MPKSVILKNTEHIIPESRDQNYAEDLTNYLVDLADQVNAATGSLDIQQTSFIFTNNQAAPADITGFQFPTSSIASFSAEYVISRDDGATKVTERGTLFGIQTTGGWDHSRGNILSNVTNTNFPGSNGDIGVTFSITSSGQVQYTSNDYTGQVTGTITFKAKAIEQ